MCFVVMVCDHRDSPGIGRILFCLKRYCTVITAIIVVALYICLIVLIKQTLVFINFQDFQSHQSKYIWGITVECYTSNLNRRVAKKSIINFLVSLTFWLLIVFKVRCCPRITSKACQCTICIEEDVPPRILITDTSSYCRGIEIDL